MLGMRYAFLVLHLTIFALYSNHHIEAGAQWSIFLDKKWHMWKYIDVGIWQAICDAKKVKKI